MLIYYDPINFQIKGLSYLPININYPYFETQDPEAEKIFLGQSPISKYEVAKTSNDALILRNKQMVLLSATPPNQRIKQVDKGKAEADVKITQNCVSKSITVSITDWALRAWGTDEYIDRKLYLIACKDRDPYNPMWAKMITRNDINDLSLTFDYQGQDDITFFSPKFFNTYCHEVISS